MYILAVLGILVVLVVLGVLGLYCTMYHLGNLFSTWHHDIYMGHSGYDGCGALCIISAICPVHGNMIYTWVTVGMRVVVHYA